MENKPSPSGIKLTLCEEKLIRDVDYTSGTSKAYQQSKRPLVLDLEILHKSATRHQLSQRVLVSIKPKCPVIKTLYIAEKSRFYTKKGSDRSGSRLAIGDHYSITSYVGNVSNLNSKPYNIEQISENKNHSDEINISSLSNILYPEKIDKSDTNKFEQCYTHIYPITTMNRTDVIPDNQYPNPIKIDKATLIITNTSSEESLQQGSNIINQLHKRIDFLERKVLKQEVIFRSIDPMLTFTSDDESKNNERSPSRQKRPKCSYIDQYSHVPETSAFHRNALQQPAPLSSSKATTIEKEHNSEQYGRDFTTYDGITARGRRQCASVPLKKDNVPKMAAERVHKIRHKLNPVRDYRLMDTVHYLAQGEFAPRDDGIKLTPSREAVLSDIIWEDVCRTHWPNTRLSRRVPHPERHSTRCELQRLIDSLLRERIAHVERRRRRHYRIVKLNHRHENCKPLGKTGDIIVASHKNKDNRDVAGSDHATAAIMSEKYRLQQYPRNRSQDRIMHVLEEPYQRPRFKHDENTPGPSRVVPHFKSQESTCYYHTINSERKSSPNKSLQAQTSKDITSGSSPVTSKTNQKNPRLLIKKDASRRKYQAKEQPNLEHYILLPTLVVRTPSNVRRQKKFNELYHRILNVQFQHERDPQFCAVERNGMDRKQYQNPDKKDISFNINIMSSESEDYTNGKL